MLQNKKKQCKMPENYFQDKDKHFLYLLYIRKKWNTLLC